MREPVVKRVNTVSFKFIKGTRSFLACELILRHELDLGIKDVIGVGQEGKNCMHIKLANNAIYKQVVSYHGETYDIDENTTLQLLDASTYKSRVFIRNVPFELNNGAIRRILGNYGSVDRVEVCTVQKAQYFPDLMSRERIAYMNEIVRPIPSNLFVDLTQCYLYFSYNDQQPTCIRCGDTEHNSKECPVSRYIQPEKCNTAIMLNTTDFPALPLIIPNNNAIRNLT